jgi:hypothetical protein
MKGKIKVVLIVSFISLFTIITSCGKQKAEWKGTIEEKNGVTVIKNPKEPIYDNVIFNLKEELSIGEAKGREEYIFSQVRSVAVDDDENIYVLDYKEAHIKVFNKKGDYLKTIGKKGQGPGELRRPVSIQITHQKEVMVSDPVGRMLVFFSLEGKYLRQISTARMRMPPDPIEMDPAGNLIGKLFIYHPIGRDEEWELKKFDSNLESLTVISKIKIDQPDKGPEMIVMEPSLLFAISKEGNVIWGNSSLYKLEVLNLEGKLIRRIEKDSNPLEITEKDKERIKKRYKRIIDRGYILLFPKYFPVFRSISIDGEGRIFVGTYERIKIGEDYVYYYDVFDSEGKYIAKIPLRRRPIVWKKNRLYTIEENEEGYQFVKRYTVKWK